MIFDTIPIKQRSSDYSFIKYTESLAQISVYFERGINKYLATSNTVARTLTIFKYDQIEWNETTVVAHDVVAYGIKHFSFNNIDYLVVSGETDGVKLFSFNIDSTTGVESIALIQTIADINSRSLDIVAFNGDTWLSIAIYSNSTAQPINMYRLDTTATPIQFDMSAPKNIKNLLHVVSANFGIMDGELYAFIGKSGAAVLDIVKYNTASGAFSSTVLQTISNTDRMYDPIYFEIGTNKFLLACSYTANSNYSKLYKHDGASFVHHQTFSGVYYVLLPRVFTINGSTYLFIPQEKGYINSTFVYEATSFIYKWDSTATQFTLYKTIDTNGAVCMIPYSLSDGSIGCLTTTQRNMVGQYNEIVKPPSVNVTFNGTSTVADLDAYGVYHSLTFKIADNNRQYIITSSKHNNSLRLSYFNGTSNTAIYSLSHTSPEKLAYGRYKFKNYIAVSANTNTVTIYNFDHKLTTGNLITPKFVTVNGVVKGLDIASVSNTLWLSVSVYKNGTDYSAKSAIFKYDTVTDTFVEYQTVNTYGSLDTHIFTILGDTYIAFVNGFNGNIFNLSTVIYKLNSTTGVFEPYQFLYGVFASSIQTFKIDNKIYCILTELGERKSTTDGVYSVSSHQHVYEYQGGDKKFVEIQTLSGYGAVAGADVVVNVNDTAYLFLSVNYSYVDDNVYDYTATSHALVWNKVKNKFIPHKTYTTYSVNNVSTFVYNGLIYFIPNAYLSGRTGVTAAYTQYLFKTT